MNTLDLGPLNEHIKKSLKGIELLYLETFFDQSKYCSYILIDQLAWLVSGNESNVNRYFKDWVERYFISHYPDISAEELWASRNGLIHNNSSISRQIEKGQVKRQLLFVDGLNHFDDINNHFDVNEFYCVNTTKFIQEALVRAVEAFYKDLLAGNIYSEAEIKRKLGKLLVEVPNK